MVVGAPRKYDGIGVVYIFERNGGEAPWVHVSTLSAPEGDDGREYGAAVATRGGEILVGAPAAGGTGAVYRYLPHREGWMLAGQIAPADQETAAFGAALSREGDHLLVGAPASAEGTGRVYAVRLQADGNWGAPGQIEVPSSALAPRAALGQSVLLRGDQAFLGAPGAAAVLIATPDDGSWDVSGALRPFDNPERSGFGFSVAAAGNSVWVGAPGIDGRNGRVYRYSADREGEWAGAALVNPDITDGSSWPLGFGYAVAAAEDAAVVGMPTRDFGEGRVMAFSRANGHWSPSQMLEGEIYRIGDALAGGLRCEEGAMTEFPCDNMEMVAHMTVDDLGGERGVWVNDVWGWEDPETGRKYALVARRDGASFVEVTDPGAPRLVGTLPRTAGARPSVWRDIKTIGNYAYIVADGAGQHGMQVFDLTRLRGVEGAPVTFEPDNTYTNMASAHNVVADTESGFLYIVGANSGGETCGGGLHMVDTSDPVNPAFAGCYSDATSPGSRGYTHDAQCLVYRGPDEDYRGRQICLGSNATELNIADVTDKSNPTTISRIGYPNVSYAHQGWFDEDQRYFYMNDEGDENDGSVDRTRTLVWDLTDLDDPILANQYFASVGASDHNLYVNGNLMYQSNYGSGLRVLDITDRENPVEIAFFDSAPYNDNGPGFSSTQSGAWSNYPFFEDGLVIFTSVREGLFIMRVDRRPVS
jgi:choice-of-anchor B domain-containing protein